MTLVNVPLWLPHHLFGWPRPFPRVRALFPASRLDCASRKMGRGRRQAAISAGAHSHSGSGKICACRGREKNSNSTSSPVSQFRPFICHPHLMIRQAHLIAPAHLAEPPRMPRCPLLPSLNGNESSTQQALSLVRRSLPLPVVGFLFSSALSPLPSAHAELSSGRSLLHQDGGQWARGQRLSTPAPSCARSQEQRANREQQSHQQSHQRRDTSEQRVLPFKMASSQYLVG